MIKRLINAAIETITHPKLLSSKPHTYEGENEQVNILDSKWDYLAEEREDWQHFNILIEEEYGYRYWIWHFHGTAEDCVEFFKNRTPDDCLSSVEKLHAPAKSHVLEVTYEEWTKYAEERIYAGEAVNGYAHWHEPYDTRLAVEDKQGNRLAFISVDENKKGK